MCFFAELCKHPQIHKTLLCTSDCKNFVTCCIPYSHLLLLASRHAIKSTRTWQMERGASKGRELCVLGQLKAADARVSAVVLAYVTVYVLHMCQYQMALKALRGVCRSECCLQSSKISACIVRMCVDIEWS